MTTPPNAKIPRRSSRGDLKAKKNTENVNDEKHVNACVELTYDVLTIIFKYLNAKDLRNAAIVCRCWYEASENEQRVRGSSALTMLGNMNNSWNDLCPGEDLSDRVKMKPMLGLMFTRPFDAKHPAAIENAVDCPCRILPSNCPHITVGNAGIVKDQTETGDLQKATFMLLPHDEKVCIDTVFLPLPQYLKDPTRRPTITDVCGTPERYALEKFKTILSSRRGFKCFVLLTSEEYRNSSKILGKFSRDRQRTLSGVVATNLALCKRNEKEVFCSKAMFWIGILISGPGVRSWSAVLRRRCDHKEYVQAKLMKLREQAKLKKHTMGFMFACEGRGEDMFGERNVESTIFKKIFPNVPLIGCSGGGEYGDSTIEKMANRTHQYSTVFMILTYGES